MKYLKLIENNNSYVEITKVDDDYYLVSHNNNYYKCDQLPELLRLLKYLNR